MGYPLAKILRSQLERKIHAYEPMPVLDAREFAWAKRVESLYPEIRKEVETLLNTDKMNIDRVSMKSVGYRQVSEYLMGDTSYDEMINKAVNATRQLAKRQMTWLRNWLISNWPTGIKKKMKPNQY